MEVGGFNDLQKLIYILDALDYSLAIVPKVVSLVRESADPWAEFW